MGKCVSLQSAVLFQEEPRACLCDWFPAHLNVWSDRATEGSFCCKGDGFSVERHLESGFDLSNWGTLLWNPDMGQAQVCLLGGCRLIVLK